MAVDMKEFVELAATEAKKQSQRVTVSHARLATAVGAQAGAQVDFCQLWPTIKSGLELLKNLVPVWARWIIDAVIAIGDRICG